MSKTFVIECDSMAVRVLSLFASLFPVGQCTGQWMLVRVAKRTHDCDCMVKVLMSG